MYLVICITNRYAKHTQHAKHTYSLGGLRSCPQKTLKIKMPGENFAGISATKL